MKKVWLFITATFLCLSLSTTAVQAQANLGKAAEEFLQTIFTKEESNSSKAPRDGKVSRKRTETPQQEPSRKEDQQQPRQREREQKAPTTSRKRTGKTDAPSRQEEEASRRRAPRQQERQPNPEQEERRRYPERREKGPSRDSQRNAPSRNGKAKCGVAGCQHPGKHLGLHKQQSRPRTIRH